MSLAARRAEAIVLGAAVLFPPLRFVADVLRGMDSLHYRYLVDDAFYYFVLARHLPTFNAGIPTSGFHPLYAFLISPLHRLLPPDAAIVGSLFLLTCAHAAGAWVLFRLLGRLFPRPIPLLCAGGWAVSTKIHTLAMTGVETILAAVAVLVCADRFVRLLQERRFGDGRAMAGLGVWIGVAFWARMDSPWILAPAAAYAFLRALREGAPRAAAALAGATAVLPLAWLATIAAWTGSLLPTSSSALRVLREDGGRTALESAMRALDAPVRHLDQYLAGDLVPLVPALAVFLAAAVVYRLRSDARRAAFGPFAVTFLAGWLLWTALCVLYLHGFRSWYGVYHAVPLYAIALPVLLAVLLERVPRRGFAVALAAALVGFLSFFSEDGPSAPQEYDKVHSARAANRYLRDLDPGARVGAFNTGIYQFYTDVDVLNLDGVVNPEALAAHRQGRIADYMREKNVRVVMENEPGRSATFRQVYGRKDIHFERWIDLSKEYEPYPGPERLTRRTSLWRVTYPSDGEGWDTGGQAMLRPAGRGSGGS